MDAIKKRSFTLIEMIIAMTLAMILTLAVSYQFVAMVQFGNALKNKATPLREANIVIAHMTNMLRSADPGSIIFEFNDLSHPPSHERLQFTLNGTTYYYETNITAVRNNYLYFSTIPDSFLSKDIISRNVGCLQASYDAANHLLTIMLRLEKNETSVNVNAITVVTTIKVLGP
ncbi:MAG: prepilin-type N-terminal cleavage/methylation domain-containing protein [Candidatus Omnitrophota bacterium]|nr:prepilin-type N-terminal cleavage/methylation domain-containing protein [Candidatus Omnitrophota bacterium]